MRTRFSNTLALTITLGTAACGSNHEAPKPDAAIDAAPPPMPDAPPKQDGVVGIPLTALGGGYTAQMKLGGQAFDVIVDTGSTTTAVADAACTNCGVHPTYTSSTGTDLHQTASAQYGSGSWKGECFEDGAIMGTRGAVPLDFASITSQTGFFQGAGYEGILGLGPDGLLLPHTTSYLTKLIAGGMTGQVAFQLCPENGTMWLGGFDASKGATAPAFTPINSAAPYDIVSVASASMTGGMALTGSDFGPTIIDTGTTLTFVPAAVVTAVSNSVSGSSGYASVFGTQQLASGACDGNTALTTTKTSAEIDQALPPLLLSFAGSSTPISIPATRAYLFDQGNGMYCFTFSDSSKLFGSSQKVSLFGNTLLAGLLTVIDIDHKQIGFAAQAGCPQAPVAPRKLVVRRPTFDADTVRAITALE